MKLNEVQMGRGARDVRENKIHWFPQEKIQNRMAKTIEINEFARLESSRIASIASLSRYLLLLLLVLLLGSIGAIRYRTMTTKQPIDQNNATAAAAVAAADDDGQPNV